MISGKLAYLAKGGPEGNVDIFGHMDRSDSIKYGLGDTNCRISTAKISTLIARSAFRYAVLAKAKSLSVTLTDEKGRNTELVRIPSKAFPKFEEGKEETLRKSGKDLADYLRNISNACELPHRSRPRNRL